MTAPWRVGLTADFRNAAGTLLFDEAALRILDAEKSIAWEMIPEQTPAVTPEQAARYDAIMILGPGVPAATLARPDRRLRHVARFGVGYDIIDLDACNRAGVLVTITPDGVRRPVAMMALTFILALAQHLLTKDRLTRTGRWHERTNWMGKGLGGRTLGLVGLGNTGRDLIRLIRPFEMRIIAADPALSPAEAAALGAELKPLDEVLRQSAFVSLHLPLTAATRGIIGERELGLMRADAYLVNTARGPIVDQAALTKALARCQIAGAGLDVFAVEPIAADDPLLALDNVVLAPHSLCWTDECWRGCAESALRAIVTVVRGQRPDHIVNPEALEHSHLKSLKTAPRTRPQDRPAPT